MADFSMKRDFKQVQWGPTLQVNLMRAFAAGLIIFIATAIANQDASMWFIPLVLPIGYLIVYVPMGLIAEKLSEKGVPYVGWVTVIIALIVMIGDPIIYILYKFAPRLVPVEHFSFINFVMILFVLKPIGEPVGQVLPGPYKAVRS